MTLSLLDQPPTTTTRAGRRHAARQRRRAGRRRLSRAVYHELLGEIVDRIAPHTEADPVAILTQLLVAFGAAVGRGACFQVEATRHHPNEFMLPRRRQRTARKGSSWDHVRRLITDARPVARATDPDRPVQWRGTDLGRARPHRPGPRHHRPAAARDRARVRVRAEGRQPRDLDPVADAALRAGTDGRSRS